MGWGTEDVAVAGSQEEEDAVVVSGRVQDWEHMQRPGTCRAPMYLQGVTQGEWVPAECLSRSVIIMYKSKYIHRGLT